MSAEQTIEERLSAAMQQAASWPDEGRLDRWVREVVLPALEAAGLQVVDKAKYAEGKALHREAAQVVAELHVALVQSGGWYSGADGLIDRLDTAGEELGG